MNKLIKLSIVAVLLAVGLSCGFFIEWSWESQAWTGGAKQSKGSVEADASGAVKAKIFEFYVEIDGGADGTVDMNSIKTVQHWSSNKADPNQRKDADKAAVKYNLKAELRPNSSPEVNGKTIKVTYIATIQFGWNKFETTAKVTRKAVNKKGDEVTKTEDVVVPVRYMFGDFGGLIPLKVVLDWDNVEADLDLLIKESNEKYVYYGNMGYNERCCLSKGCYKSVKDAQACTAIEIKNNVGVIEKGKRKSDGYVTGKGRITANTFGTLDKDDRILSGPEVYTLDPGEAQTDGKNNVPAEYKDGDKFNVEVNFYQEWKPGAMTVPVVSIYINGSDTPRCFKTNGKVGKNAPGGADFDSAEKPEANLVFGTFTYKTSNEHTFDKGAGGKVSEKASGNVGIEEFPPFGNRCVQGK